eukprot:508553-Alexandrium_andersonii.AAC.1
MSGSPWGGPTPSEAQPAPLDSEGSPVAEQTWRRRGSQETGPQESEDGARPAAMGHTEAGGRRNRPSDTARALPEE